MSTTHSTTVGIDYEPARVSNLGRLALVAVLAALLVAGLLATVAAVPTLAFPLLLVAWTALVTAVVAGLVFGVQAVGASL
ncbi:hypothetical protein [Haloarchaeobius baliensis]|uniref:hypothetical protein n=1 Tax=Haloarchaeobius baliensis TaxID=1670458 RepID=UPI003F8857F3